MSEICLYEKNLNKQTNFNVWFAFPECNSFSLSSLGYMWLYKELDESDDIFVERICTDTEKTRLRSDEVDAIGFSLSFDLDFINVFKIFEKYNIPFKSGERKNGEYPVIFAGGPVITANPRPYDEIFDFMVIGDGEGVNEGIGINEEVGVYNGVNIRSLRACKDFPRWKMENGKWEINQDFYNKLSEIEGVYIPKVHNIKNKVKKSHSDLSECIYTPILSDESFFKNTFIIETSRGCYNCCGFCIASYLNLPTRFVDYETIIEKIDLGLKYTNKIALLGALVSAHPRFEDICKYIYDKVQSGREIEMSISSMRSNTLTPDIIKTFAATGQKHITIAIEAASERLRKVINKHITEEQIFDAIRISKENGLKGIKIYAMLGLPTETDEDVKEFIRLAKDLKSEFKGFDITFSFSTFVPKPHTPLQWCAKEGTKSLEKKINYLSKEFHKIGMNVKFSSPKWDFYQTLLSRGDETLGDYLIEVYKQGGKLGAYKSAAKQLGIDTEKYTTREYAIEEPLPWDIIDIRPDKELLIREYNRLLGFS